MTDETAKPENAHRTTHTEVRRLEPGSIRLFRDENGVLTCDVAGEGVYRGVFCLLLFPVSEPNRFISLRYSDQDDQIHEIGVIENLNKFDPETQAAVRESLTKHYHQKTIRRILNLRCDYGWLLTFEVETDCGKEEFKMRWRHDRAENYGRRGKVLLDVFENRYIIPDVSKLPAKDRRRLTSFIYW